MKALQILGGALETLQWHRMRAALTVLGILIGIAAVMITVGIGEGAQLKVTQQIASLGSNLLTVTPGSSTSASGVRGGLGTANTLTLQDAQAISSPSVAPAVSGVAPEVTKSETLANGATTWTTTVYGTTANWMSIRSRTLSAGRFISASDLASRSPVVVLGALTAQELFGSTDPVGDSVLIGNLPATVIGVLAPIGSGTSAQTNQDDLAILPITTAQTYLVGTANLESVKAILVKARSGSQLSAAYQEIDHELLALHGIANPANADFTITAEQSIVSVATSVTTTLTYLLGSVAAVSLLVGGVGVMNIMLVSVTERRREIGLRKALGATRRAIQVQFLAEATVLGLAGGLCGVGLGELGALILPRIVGYPVSIPATATAAALVLAAVISIGFGVYPAARAARLSPIDALRSE